MLLHFDMLGVP